MITVFIAGEPRLIREGLRSLVESTPDTSVLGDSDQTSGVVDEVRRCRPDVLLLSTDVLLPSQASLGLISRVRSDIPGTAVIVVSLHDNADFVNEALSHGARGFVSKGAAGDELKTAIQAVAVGRQHIDLRTTERALAQATNRGALDALRTLSFREHQVLTLAAQGRRAEDISRTLVLSRRTVEMHRRRMMHKLSLANQTQLVVYALERGIVRRDDIA